MSSTKPEREVPAIIEFCRMVRVVNGKTQLQVAREMGYQTASNVMAVETSAIKSVSLKLFLKYAKACGVQIEARIMTEETGDES